MNYPDSPRPDSFQSGLEFQDHVMDVLRDRAGLLVQAYGSKKYQYEKGETAQGVEIKLDDLCSQTGRLSIEVYEKSKRDVLHWTPSGILRDDNTLFYAQGNHDCLFLFFKHQLKWYFETKRPEVTEKHGTIKTFYLPLKSAGNLGLRIYGGPNGR